MKFEINYVELFSKIKLEPFDLSKSIESFIIYSNWVNQKLKKLSSPLKKYFKSFEEEILDYYAWRKESILYDKLKNFDISHNSQSTPLRNVSLFKNEFGSPIRSNNEINFGTPIRNLNFIELQTTPLRNQTHSNEMSMESKGNSNEMNIESKGNSNEMNTPIRNNSNEMNTPIRNNIINTFINQTPLRNNINEQKTKSLSLGVKHKIKKSFF
jgi:hypothetical protein